jgi:hypothetical protein
MTKKYRKKCSTYLETKIKTTPRFQLTPARAVIIMKTLRKLSAVEMLCLMYENGK